MIRFECTQVYGWEAAIRGMRNPLESWKKSDSWMGCRNGDYGRTETHDCGRHCFGDCEFCIGPEDKRLMLQLIKAGSDHAKFLRYIGVTVDITAPMYWWKEADTYKVGTVRNSCSTMHKVMSREFVLEDFSINHLSVDSINLLAKVINWLNDCRSHYLNLPESAKEEKKQTWWQVIQLLPSSYNQRSTMHLNYEVLRRMYASRCIHPHKLDEWSIGFKNWVESLPYSELITRGTVK